MSSELQGTGLDLQIIQARVKTNTVIVHGTASADELEELTGQIQEVTVSIQVGLAAPTPFEPAVPTGPASAEWAAWTFRKPLPLGSFKRKITVTAEFRIGAKTETTTVEIPAPLLRRPILSLAYN